MLPSRPVEAQDAISEVIKAGIKKAIKAVDLKIQRLQTETIWLQNAQKVIENTMAKVHLEEISGWVEKQRTIYADYYTELWKVKSIIVYYDKVKEISNTEKRIVEEYKRAMGLFKKDGHFSSSEIAYMADVYEGILSESLKNLNQIFFVINPFSTQMSDGSRLKVIEHAAEKIEGVFSDLKAFNTENIMLSLQGAKSQNEVEAMKRMYAIIN